MIRTASRKEYEMLFRLNAQTASGFNAAFSGAQKQIAAIQQDIQKLNSLQGDIAAYQKQQSAVENTTKKLDTLKQQYANIQKEISETTGLSSKLENQLLAKQQQIDKTSKSLENQTSRLTDMGTALRDAGIDTANLEAESKRLGAEMDSLKEEQIAVAESAEQFGENTVDAFENIAEVIAAVGIAAAVQEIAAAFTECISVAGEFQDSMSNVNALSGASAQEMAELSALAKELGATTQFTAKESADAMGFMAMAGWDAQQMIAGMPGVLRLAAASGEDFAMVSDIVTDSMTAFGLSVSDTSHYADVLAAAATNANTNVSMMGETFKYAAPMAGALGYSAEDVAVAVGMMANAGIKGSQAGTSLNNIFTRLAKPTKESADAMDALGISLLDSSGNMYTFMELMEIMRDRFSGLTETQKAFYAAELAGQRGMAGLLSIVNASESDFAKLSNSIDTCSGAAERMANIKLDTMNGQLTIMNSAAEALRITVGEQFTPILKDLYSTGADALTVINTFLQKHPGIIKAVAALTIGIGAATAAIAAYVAVTKVAAIVTTALKTTLNPIAALTIGIGAALTTVAAGMVLTRHTFDDTTHAARVQKDEIDRLQKEYENACETFGETSTEAGVLRYRIQTLTDAYESSQHSIKGLTGEHDALVKSVAETSQTYHDSLKAINDEKLDGLAIAAELQRMANAYRGTTEETALMKRMLDELSGTYGDLDISIQDVISGTADWKDVLTRYITEAAQAQEQTAKLQRAVELFKLVNPDSGKLFINAAELKSELEAAEEELTHWQNRLREQPDMVRQSIFGGRILTFGNEYTDAAEKVRVLTAAYQEAASELEKAQNEYNDLTAALGGLADGSTGAADGISRLQNIINLTTTDLDTLVTSYQEAYDAALKSVQGQYEIWDEAAEVIPKSVEDMTNALQSQIDYWKDYRENLDYLRDAAPNIEGLADLMPYLADGSTDSMEAVAGLTGALKSGSGDVEVMVDTWQELRGEQNLVADSIADTAEMLSAKMDEMAAKVEQAVRDMDVSDLSAQSAASTIQAFIDQASSMEPGVQRAYSNLGMAAARALESSFNNITANLTFPTLPGYASGTDDAVSGPAIVGEHGAEMVFFHGGETVLTANETRALRNEILMLKKSVPEIFSSAGNSFQADVLNAYALYNIARTTHAYASGTSDAVPGPAVVGEYGAELVFPPLKTNSIYRNTSPESVPSRFTDGINLTFSPSYQVTINGGSDRRDLESVLRKHDDTLRISLTAMLDDWWEDKRVDSARRRF